MGIPSCQIDQRDQIKSNQLSASVMPNRKQPSAKQKPTKCVRVLKDLSVILCHIILILLSHRRERGIPLILSQLQSQESSWSNQNKVLIVNLHDAEIWICMVGRVVGRCGQWVFGHVTQIIVTESATSARNSCWMRRGNVHGPTF